MKLLWILPILVLDAFAQNPDEVFIAPVYELGSNVPTIKGQDNVAPGKPATTQQPELVNRYDDKEQQQTVVPPSFVLGSNPPVSHIHTLQPGPIIPPGEPWPAYDDKTTKKPPTTSTTRSTTRRTTKSPFNWPTVVVSGIGTNKPTTQHTIDVVNRFDGGETTVKPSVVLDYKPMRPSFHPSPGNTIGQIIPPGEPWPADPEGYENFGNRPQTTSRRPTTTTRKSEGTNDIFNRFDDKTTVKPSVVLDYKPMRPSFHPSPGNTIGQIIPPGEPWPANPEGYENFGNRPQTTTRRPTKKPEGTNDIVNRFDDKTTQKPSIVLDYKPTRPSFHPNPGNNVAQIIPPGEPWPARGEERPMKPFNPEGIFNRFEEENKKDDRYPQYAGLFQEFYPSDAYALGQVYENPQIVYLLGGDYEDSYPRPAIILDYKPIRPFYHPKPGNLVAQIVPPGKPWPAR